MNEALVLTVAALLALVFAGICFVIDAPTWAYLLIAIGAGLSVGISYL